MENERAKAFLEYLREHDDEREALKGAVLEEIVAAGEAAGYHFSKSDLETALKGHAILNVSGWSPHG